MTTRLYLVSPPAIDVPVVAKALAEAFKGGAASAQAEGNNNIIGSFQLRLKNAGDGEIIEAANALRPLCHAHDAAFILNDRPDLAAACNADGVHIGQEDLKRWTSPPPNPLPEGEGMSAFSHREKGGGSRNEGCNAIKNIRAIIGPERVIGVSCHDSRHLAMEAGEQGADYVAFGAFYPTKSKSPEALAKYGTPKPDILDWWRSDTILPCVAIGGITPRNCQPLVKAGADFIAVITAVWEHAQGPKRAVEEFNETIGAVGIAS